MARTGVSYSEVAEAATQLIGQGRNPTVEQVRLLLGTGSSTTIGNHLRTWKTHQDTVHLVSAKENIPSELVAVMKGLWDRVVNHSQEQITVIESGYQQTILELEQEVEKYKKNNQRWQKMFNQWTLEKNELANEKLTLEQALEFSQKENISLGARQDALLQQLQDKHERIDELNRLHKQIQENLEHYRESAREQRLLDQQQHEQQKQQLNTEIKMLNEKAVIQIQNVFTLQQQLETLQQSYVNLDKSYAQTLSQYQELVTELQQSEKTRDEHQHASLHWQNQYTESQKSLNEKTNLFIEARAEAKLLTKHMENAQQALASAEDQHKLVNNEKWMLAQENARLEGQLKQMQKMINA